MRREDGGNGRRLSAHSDCLTLPAPGDQAPRPRPRTPSRRPESRATQPSEKPLLEPGHPARLRRSQLVIQAQEMKKPVSQQDIELALGGVPQLRRLALQNGKTDDQLAQVARSPEDLRRREAQDIGGAVLAAEPGVEPGHPEASHQLDAGPPVGDLPGAESPKTGNGASRVDQPGQLALGQAGPVGLPPLKLLLSLVHISRSTTRLVPFSVDEFQHSTMNPGNWAEDGQILSHHPIIDRFSTKFQAFIHTLRDQFIPFALVGFLR